MTLPVLLFILMELQSSPKTVHVFSLKGEQNPRLKAEG